MASWVGGWVLGKVLLLPAAGFGKRRDLNVIALRLRTRWFQSPTGPFWGAVHRPCARWGLWRRLARVPITGRSTFARPHLCPVSSSALGHVDLGVPVVRRFRASPIPNRCGVKIGSKAVFGPPLFHPEFAKHAIPYEFSFCSSGGFVEVVPGAEALGVFGFFDDPGELFGACLSPRHGLCALREPSDHPLTIPVQ